MAKILITGSEGFIGKALSAECARRGHEVFGADLVAATGRERYRQLDLRTGDVAAALPEGLDAVIHLAGLSRDGDCKGRATACFEANVHATLRLIDAAKERSAKQFIFASSEWVYGEMRDARIRDEDEVIDLSALASEYALSKLVSEANLRQQHGRGFCPVTILRFGITYGPKTGNFGAVEALFHSVVEGRDVSVGSLRTGRHFIHVADLARGIAAAIGRTGFEILNLGGERLVTLGDVIAAAQEITGSTVTVTETDPEKYNVRNVSSARAYAALAWKPELGLADGLRTLLEGRT